LAPAEAGLAAHYFIKPPGSDNEPGGFWRPGLILANFLLF